MICVHDRRIFKNLTNMRYLALSLILLFFNCKPTKAIETPETMECIKTVNENNIVAFIALAISIFTALYQVCYNRRTLRLTQDHNSRSLYANVTLNTFISKPENLIRFYLINNGNGTAILKSIVFNNPDVDGVFDKFSVLLHKKLAIDGVVITKDSYNMTEQVFSKTHALSPTRDSYSVFDFKYIKHDKDFDTILEIVRNTKCIINYDNLYGDEIYLTENLLDT